VQEIIMALKRAKRALLGALAVLASIFLIACSGSYHCAVTFGASSCTPASGSGTGSGTGGGGGGGGGSATAYVFAIDEGGTIDGYTLNNSGGTFAATSGYTAPSVPANGGGVGLVVANQQFLYAGFGVTQTIYGWSISSSGGLTAVSGSPYSASFMSTVGNGLVTSSVITNPAGTLLFFASSLGEIFVYQINSDGTLTAVTGSPFAAGISPTNMTTDGLGKYLYATDGNSNHLGSEVAAFAIGSTGTLTPVAGSPFILPLWQVQGEPTGNFLIGTTGQSAGINGSDNDALYVYSITQTGANAGALTAVTGSPFATTYSPYAIAVQPDTGGNLVYSFGFNDDLTGFNPPEAYSIDPTTGALTVVSGSPFANAAEGSWGQFDQSGGNLFLWGEVNSSGTFTYPLSALQVSSAGAISQPTSPLDLATQGFWAVTDPPTN
jgi:6-phosphogluconolactonase